jgi:peptidoglycan hydrolase-like protein with peptidoglycan-binding domain
MIKSRNVAALLALASIAALPACSSTGSGSYSSQPNNTYASHPPALSPGMIEQVQTRLQQAGTYNGSIDGLWGPATEAGVRSYQQQHNLNATGQLNGDTLASLNLGGTSQNSGNTQPYASPPPTAMTPPTASVPPVASAPTPITPPAAIVQPTGNTPPPSQVYGAGNSAPTTTVMPTGNATQPNASTTP